MKFSIENSPYVYERICPFQSPPGLNDAQWDDEVSFIKIDVALTKLFSLNLF